MMVFQGFYPSLSKPVVWFGYHSCAAIHVGARHMCCCLGAMMIELCLANICQFMVVLGAP
jgi:hypothetical protein